MADSSNHADDLAAVSRAMVALHKEHVGRGPTRARSYFSGANTLICVMEDALLPYERKMVELGDADRVRDSRLNFQAATRDLFIAAVEQTLHRRVIAFASAVDPEHDVVFENFTFEPIGLEEAADNLTALPSGDG